MIIGPSGKSTAQDILDVVYDPLDLADPKNGQKTLENQDHLYREQTHNGLTVLIVMAQAPLS